MSSPAGFQPTTLGRTGLAVGRLGLGASYGVPTAAVERGFEAGMNYLFWASIRTGEFAAALRYLKPKRDRMVLVLESYSRVAGLVGWSVERALRSIGYDHADVLLFGMWNKPVPDRFLEAAGRLKERGLVRFIGVSTHKRPLVPKLAADLDVVHFRYSAVHTGAERDIFPHLPAGNRAGMVGFTATSWKRLLGHRRIPKNERVPTAGDCYRFVLARPEIDVCLTGPSQAGHVEEAIAALERGPMAEEELAWMRRVGAAIYGRV
jgi:aryl-alcohol dehydrogenase-like predicted oxidoreductase